MHRVLLCLSLLASAPATAQAPTADPAPPIPTAPVPPIPDDPLATPSPPPEPAEPPARRLPTRVEGDERVTADEPSEDLFLMGQEATLAAPVHDNAFVMAQQVTVEAPVLGDLFAMGQNVQIDAPVSGDVYALGAQVVLSEAGSVGGNLHAAAGEVEIGGSIGGDVSIGAGEVVLAAPIAGDVALEVGQLTIEEGARIGGALTYTAPHPAEGLEALGAQSVAYTEQIEPVEEPPSAGGRIVGWVMWTSWSYLSKLLVGFAALALGGPTVAQIGRTLREKPAESLGFGFVLACVLPVASTLAIVTILPLPLGIVGWMVFGILMYAAQILAAQTVGDLILRQIRPGALGSPYVSMAVGLAPLVLIVSLPWLGSLAWLVATLGGLGALWLTLRRPTLA